MGASGPAAAWMLLSVFLLSGCVHFAGARGGDVLMDRKHLEIPIQNSLVHTSHANQTVLMDAAILYLKLIPNIEKRLDDLEDIAAPDEKSHYVRIWNPYYSFKFVSSSREPSCKIA
eukprot:9503710-Pyramimonas_sp.AAC.1